MQWETTKMVTACRSYSMKEKIQWIIWTKTKSQENLQMKNNKADIIVFIQRKLNQRSNRDKSFGLIWGQCSSASQSYIEGLTEYVDISRKFDLMWLLDELKKATYVIDYKANPFVTVNSVLATLYHMKQWEH